MSEYHGDIDLGDTVQWLFTTVNGSGVPTILTGSPTATAYTDGGVTQSATGVTLTADFDGVTGQNLISIVATGGNGFAAGENIEIVLDAGTVDGNTVVGYAIGGFSIANRSPLRPTTIGRTLDILATGEVPIDFDTSIGTLAASQIEASALDGKGDWNVGKTGYTLTQSFPTNFADMSITVTTGRMDVGSWLGTAVTTSATSAKPEMDTFSISNDATAADNLEASAETIVLGTAETGTLSTTQMTTDLSEATDDHYIGRTIIWRTGVLTGQATDITDYAGTGGLLTFTAVTEVPSNGDTFIII